MSSRRRVLLPTLSRYLGREFLRTFGLMVTAFVAIFVIADFFDRFDDFLKHGTAASVIVRAFLYKIPLILGQVTPVAVLAGGLIGLGLLARNHEFVALRGCGVSVWQIALPLAAIAAVISLATFAWNETIVPASTRRWNETWNQEVKRRRMPVGVFTGREVWFHGQLGFYNINRVAPRRRTLYGLTVYQLDPRTFRPRRVIEAATAEWLPNERRWEFRDGHTQRIDGEGIHLSPGVPENFQLPERLKDFSVAAVEPEEFSYAMLRRQIKSLTAKGVNTSESWVDLHLKIAAPAASLVMILLAIPLAARGTRATSLPAAAALGFAVGFSYFVVVGFSRALGHAGTLPPLVAAWAANAVFALVGGYYLLSAE